MCTGTIGDPGSPPASKPRSQSPARSWAARACTASRRQSSSTAMRTAASAAPRAAGTPEAVNRNGRQAMRNQSRTERGPIRKPPHDASDLENVPMTRSGWMVVSAQPVEKGLLELAVQRERAVHEAAAGDAAAVALDGVHRSLLDPVVAGEAQVVVGPQHDHRPPVVDDRGARFAGHLLEEGAVPGRDRLQVQVLPRIRALGENVPTHRARRYRVGTVRSMTPLLSACDLVHTPVGP